MNKLLMIAGAVSALALTSAPAAAATSVAATTNANAHAKIMKPLQIEGTQDLDFGTMVISGTGSQVMKVDQAGVLTGCGAIITCSGTPQAAIYNVKGTPSATVKVTVASPVVLTNANDGSTLDLTPDAPGTVLLDTDAASTGDDFNIGGSITIDSAATTDGLYSGTFAVSVDYQ
ncbi:MAG TPA: DUF4402 domain-containing protein [Sphingomicrobium sp.]|jgi:hypothetical protein|nr:DUF4402 domain-containing protein [Sphingomicrobium sp.]